LQNIGLPVFQTFLNTFAFTNMRVTGTPPVGETGTPLSMVRAVADDIEGVVWFSCYTGTINLANRKRLYAFGYNARTQKWAATGVVTYAYNADEPQPWLTTTHADMRTYLGADFPSQARVWYLDNWGSAPKLKDLRYPDAWDSTRLPGSVAMAPEGTYDRSTDAMRVYARCLPGSDATPFSTCTLYGYSNAQRNVGTQTANCTLNSELESFDGRLSARFKLAYLVGASAKWCILDGVGLEYPQTGSR